MHFRFIAEIRVENIVIQSFGDSWDQALEMACKLIMDTLKQLIQDQNILKITNSI